MKPEALVMLGCIGIMEKKMETMGIIKGLSREHIGGRSVTPIPDSSDSLALRKFLKHSGFVRKPQLVGHITPQEMFDLPQHCAENEGPQC